MIICPRCGVGHESECFVTRIANGDCVGCASCLRLPKPAALSPDMLGEEDREALAYVKQLVLDYRRRMSLKRIEIGNSNDADVVWYYDNEVEQAHKGVLLLLRLLGSADAKGGE